MQYKTLLWLLKTLTMLNSVLILQPYRPGLPLLIVFAILLVIEWLLLAKFGKCPCCGAKYREARIDLPPRHRCQVCGEQILPDPDPAKAPAMAKLPGIRGILLTAFLAGLAMVAWALWGKFEAFPWPLYLTGMAIAIVSYLLHPYVQMYAPSRSK